MNLKNLLIGSLVMSSGAVYAQTGPTLVSNKGDKIRVSDLKVEPWNVSNSTNQATLNNQSIYQDANVGIGNYSTLTPGSKLEIRTNNTSQLGLVNALNDSKFDISKEANALTITSRRPGNNRLFNLYSDGSLYLGSTLFNDNLDAGSNTGAGFVYQSSTRRLGLNIPISNTDGSESGLPTQTLDLGGNARVRGLANGSDVTVFPNVVVADNSGVLGKSSIAGISSAAEPWNVSGSLLKATANNQHIYQNGAIGIGDFSTTNLAAFGPSLNINRPAGGVLMNLTSGAITNYINFFQNNATGNSNAATALGFLSSLDPTRFSILNKLTGGITSIISEQVGIQTDNPRTEFDVAGQSYFRKTVSIGSAKQDVFNPINDTWLNVGISPGSRIPAARFSMNNCGVPCGQGPGRNLVFNNTNGTNTEFASLAFYAKSGQLSQADYDGNPAAEIAGSDRDVTNNYGGFTFRTNNASGFATRFRIRSTGRIEIKDVGATSDNTLDKILAVDGTIGQVGYIDKASISSAAEPWQVQNSTTKATANTENIYQSGSVAVGLNNTDGVFDTQGALVVKQKNAAVNNTTNGLPAIKLKANSTAELYATVEGPDSRQLRLLADNNDQGIDGVSFTMKNARARVDAANTNFNPPAGVTLPADNTNMPYDVLRSYANGRTAINQMKTNVNTTTDVEYPTEALDIVQGNARIRGLANGSAFTDVVVADANGVLGRKTIASLGGGAATEPWRVVGSTTQATANTQSIYQDGKVAIGNFSGSTPALSATEKFRVEKGDIVFRGEESNYSDLLFDHAGTDGGDHNAISFRKSRGTLATPAAVAGGDNLGSIIFKGYDGAAYSTRSTINVTQARNASEFNRVEITGRRAGDALNSAYIIFNQDRTTSIGNLIDGSNVNNFDRSVVAKPDGTLGIVARTIVSQDGTTAINAGPMDTGVNADLYVPSLTKNIGPNEAAVAYKFYKQDGKWFLDFIGNSTATVEYSYMFFAR